MRVVRILSKSLANMREICHLQAGQCGNQIGAKVKWKLNYNVYSIDLSGARYNQHNDVIFFRNFSFGKSFPTSTASIQPGRTTAIRTYSWNASTYTTPKHLVNILLTDLFRAAEDYNEGGGRVEGDKYRSILFIII